MSNSNNYDNGTPFEKRSGYLSVFNLGTDKNGKPFATGLVAFKSDMESRNFIVSGKALEGLLKTNPVAGMNITLSGSDVTRTFQTKNGETKTAIDMTVKHAYAYARSAKKEVAVA